MTPILNLVLRQMRIRNNLNITFPRLNLRCPYSNLNDTRYKIGCGFIAIQAFFGIDFYNISNFNVALD